MAGKKNKGVPGGLVWLALTFFTIAVVVGVWAFFSDDYGRNQLFSVPFWIAGVVTLAYIGKKSQKK